MPTNTNQSAYIRWQCAQKARPKKPNFPPGTPVLLTWRLYGSLPPATPALSAEIDKLSGRDRLIRIEKLLDSAKYGPTYLADRRVAQMVCEAIEKGDAEFHRYKLHAYVVMPNHVHMLATPADDLGKMMAKLKGFTSHQANAILARAGETFWQSRYFDQYSRGQENFKKMQNYVAKNPIWAGLAKTSEEFPWSSAHRKPPASTRQ